MALVRPPLAKCGFAALGPQLQQIAQAVDSEAATLQTDNIFEALRAPGLVAGQGGVTQPMPPSTMEAVVWTQEEYRSGDNFDIIFIGDNFPARIDQTTDPPRRHWFYASWFVKTAGSPADTTWWLRTNIEDVDPLTGASTSLAFEKSFLNTNGSTNEELLWMELFFRSGGGLISTFAFQNSAGLINIGSGKFAITQFSSQR